jgi:hypothetical protein
VIPRKSFVLLSLAASPLAGCVFIFHDYAQLIGPLPGQAAPYRLEVQTVSGPFAFNLHAGAFGREVTLTTISLPRTPHGRTEYSWNEIRFESSDDDRVAKMTASGGSITVDLPTRQLEIRIQSQSGECPINGSYSLKLGTPTGGSGF